MDTKDDSTPPKNLFHERIMITWKSARCPKPEEISRSALLGKEAYELPVSTVKEWLGGRIPRLASPVSRQHFAVFLGILGASGDLGEWEALERAARRAPAKDGSTAPHGRVQRDVEQAGLGVAEGDIAGDEATDRSQAGAVPSVPVGPSGPGGWRQVPRIRLIALAGLATVVVVFVTVLVLSSSAPGTAGQPAGAERAGSGPTVSTSVTPRGGPRVVVIPVPLSRISPSLAIRMGKNPADTGGYVNGYKFTNDSGNRCLNANNRGSTAGQNGDNVQLWDCYYDTNEVWFPVQWEQSGRKVTWLVSEKYQSKCLYANIIPGKSDGRLVELWECGAGSAGGEDWDFGDWYNGVNQNGVASPILLGGGPYCLDADTSNQGNGSTVRIWTAENAANQLWS